MTRPHAHFGGDLGFASDSSALVGVAEVDKKLQVVAIEEIRPKKGAPLKPKAVIDAFAEIILAHGADAFAADGHYRESAREHLEPHGIKFIDAPTGRDGKTETYLLARKLIHEGRVRLPNHPRLLAQLRSVVSRPVPGGGVQIGVPRRKGAGHGDLVSALVLALWRAQRNRRKQEQPKSVGCFFAGSSFEDITVGGRHITVGGGNALAMTLAATVVGPALSGGR